MKSDCLFVAASLVLAFVACGVSAKLDEMEVSEHQPNINDVLHADTQSSLLAGESRTLQVSCTGDDRVECARNKVYVCIHNKNKDVTICIHEGHHLRNFLARSNHHCGICCDITQPEIECCETSDCEPSPNPSETVNCQMNQCAAVSSCEINPPEIECCETADCVPSPNPSDIVSCFFNKCEIAVPGRPFRDADGGLVTADYRVCDEAVWSAISAQPKERTATSNAKVKTEDTDEASLGSEWARRAVGEHASIASFAAFTIALMSNGAPPDLIRDSLLAALDELGHAKTAFEMASLLTGRHMEPGALAPSRHSFDGDITALAIGAASEGCIAETLSALVLATEVDNAARLDGVYSLLAEKTRTIALEEGKHSSLAWRTIRWVCNIDEAACLAVKTQVLNPPNLIGAGRKRLASAADDDVGKAWTRIHEALLPLTTSAQVSATLDCDVGSVGEVNEATRLTSVLVHSIIHGVQCEDGYVRSSVK